MRASLSQRIPLVLLVIALAMLPLFEGGNGSFGLALGLSVVPALLLYHTLRREVEFSRLASLLIALYLLVALLTTTYAYPSLKVVVFIVSGLSAYALSAYYVRTGGWWRLLMGAMVVSAVAVALYGLFLYSPHLGAISQEHKLASTFGLHNSAAAFLLLTWPLAFALVERKRTLLAPSIGGFVLVLALMLTFSRAAYIAFALQALYLLLVALLARRKRIVAETGASSRSRLVPVLAVVIAAVVLGLVALGFGGFFGAVGQRVASILNLDDYSLGGRLAFWRAAAQMFIQYPLSGVGLGNFGFHFTYLQPNWHYYSTDAHGLIFKFLAEGGMVGFAFIVGLGLAFLRVLRRSAGAGSAAVGRGWQRAFVMTALLGFFLHSLVDFDWTYLANVVFFAVLAGVVAGAAQWKERMSQTPNVPNTVAEGGSRRHLGVRPLALVVVVGLLAQIALGAAFSVERHWLDRARGADGGAELSRALRVIPFNASTRVDLALEMMSAQPPAFKEAAGELRKARVLNPYESQAWFLLSQIPQGDLEERIGLAQRAIELDPFNRPPYYLGLARLYRQAGDASAELSVLTLADHRFAISERITPDFPRPLWVKYNITFATMYRRLAELTRDENPELASMYARLAREFEK